MSDKFPHRTKIVATVGPACANPETLRQMILAGANTFRLNFSHGSHEVHQRSIRLIRQVENELNTPVGILQDLQGPKIRVGKFKNGKIELKKDQIVEITIDATLGDDGLIPSDFPEIVNSVELNDEILMDDGLIAVRVEEKLEHSLKVRVIHGGTLRDRKGINIPGRTLKVDCLTQKDLEDLEFGLQNNLDAIALSFVRFPSDIRRLREIIDAKAAKCRICAKIEMREAIENLEEIVRLADLVMVARGDLAESERFVVVGADERGCVAGQIGTGPYNILGKILCRWFDIRPCHAAHLVAVGCCA